MFSVAAGVLPCDAARGGVRGIAVRVSGVGMEGEVGVSLLAVVVVVVVKVRMGLWMAVMFRIEVECSEWTFMLC